MRANESLAWLLDWSSVLLASISAFHTFSPPGDSLDGPTKISCRIGWYAAFVYAHKLGRTVTELSPVKCFMYSASYMLFATNKFPGFAAMYVAREGASARSASQRACFEAVRTSSLKSFCASILKSAGRSNKTVSSQQINAFYKSNRSQHAGVKFLDRMYGKSVGQDGTLSARKVQILNCVAGGRLLKTVNDYEACERILAQIDPKYFKDEFSVFFDENGSIRRSQSQQFTDLLRSRADEYLNVVRSDRSLSEAEEAQRDERRLASSSASPRTR